MDLPTPMQVRDYVDRVHKYAVLTQRERQEGFLEGDMVRKRSGYEFDSTVVSVFQNLDGETRLVCESSKIPGMLHIFSPQQMTIVGDDGDQLTLV